MIFQDPWNWVAFGLFLTLWTGYTIYAKKAARYRECLSALLYTYRLDWVTNMARRENRITDVALQSNLSYFVNFLATTTILAIAGVLTAVFSADHFIDLLSSYSFVALTNMAEVQFKLLFLALIFIFAFFKFTWSMRQHTFYSIMIGALPHMKGERLTKEEEDLILMAVKVSDRASHEFNYGLRSYYYALAVLTWFISPWLFMLASVTVITVLYTREFRSKTLSYLVRGKKTLGQGARGVAPFSEANTNDPSVAKLMMGLR